MEKEKLYPESHAVQQLFLKAEGHELSLSIVRHSSGHYCGYIRFKQPVVKEEGYQGLLTYVPVHGGITYAEHDAEGWVYGFDCAHLRDAENPLFQQMPWLVKETISMAISIIEASKWEYYYLLRKESWIRAEVIDAFHEALEEKYGISAEDITNNFGVCIRLLSGQL